MRWFWGFGLADADGAAGGLQGGFVQLIMAKDRAAVDEDLLDAEGLFPVGRGGAEDMLASFLLIFELLYHIFPKMNSDFAFCKKE